MQTKLHDTFPRNWRRIAGVLLAVLLLGVTPSLVTAGNNGAQTAHFTASYFNGQGGYFTGAGERIVKTAPKAFTKDSETLTISDISTWPPGTYIIGVTANWFSDFDGQVAVSGTLVVTDNGDGTGTMDVEVYY